jgi:hypothetical protein
MKTKPAAKTKKSAGKLKDIKPKKNPKGGAQRSKVTSISVTF